MVITACGGCHTGEAYPASSVIVAFTVCYGMSNALMAPRKDTYISCSHILTKGWMDGWSLTERCEKHGQPGGAMIYISAQGAKRLWTVVNEGGLSVDWSGSGTQ